MRLFDAASEAVVGKSEVQLDELATKTGADPLLIGESGNVVFAVVTGVKPRIASSCELLCPKRLEAINVEVSRLPIESARCNVSAVEISVSVIEKRAVCCQC